MLLTKIITPPLVCLLILMIIKPDVDYLPLIFGIILGTFNLKKNKYRHVLGVFICILISYVAYSLAILSLGIYEPIRNFINEYTSHTLSKENIGLTGLIISQYIIAPLLVFYLYKFIFNYSINKKVILIITCSICVLIIFKLLFNFVDNKYEAMRNLEFVTNFGLWQFIMMVALQILIISKYNE